MSEIRLQNLASFVQAYCSPLGFVRSRALNERCFRFIDDTSTILSSFDTELFNEQKLAGREGARYAGTLKNLYPQGQV